MTSPRTPGRIRADMRARESDPHGRARVAAAETLLAEARASGDGPALVDALGHLATGYALGARARSLPGVVGPLLGLWDENRQDFGDEAAFRLHWALRWVVEGLLDDPGAPFTEVEKWLTEMRRRHTEAGHSLRALHRREFTAATHAGDQERAATAHTAWLAAPHDTLADCHACESAAWGTGLLAEGEDEAALHAWQPALRGEHTCPGRPDDALALSLLPLTRLGRTDEARLHHIRGYLLTRDDEGARGALADHLAFCARTGNEPRALEILDEQNARSPHRWHEAEDTSGYGAWMTSVALVTRRLTALGHGDTPVPGPPGHEWTARTLLHHASAEALGVAARFDRRRGDTTASDGCRTRIAAEPLVADLPLGLGGPVLPTLEAPEPSEPADPYALLAEARDLSAVGHPTALAAWARLEDTAAHTGTRLTDGEHAELLDHRAMEQVRTDPAGGAVRFTEAAQLYAMAGMPGEALACRARAVLARAFAGREARALEEIGPLCERARRQRAEGRVSTRHATAVLLTRARIRVLLLGERATEQEAARVGEAVDAELAALVAFAESDRAEPAVLARIAEATETRGRLAAQSGQTARAGELLTEAATLSREAGRPWAATGADLTLARLLTETGEHASAAALLSGTLEDTARAATHTPADLARLHLALADVYAAGGLTGDEAGALRRAAHWADRADRAAAGAHARLRLGGCLLDLERPDEAEAVLESLLPQLVGARDASASVRACHWLAQACDSTGRLAEAAERLLHAADSAQAWDDRSAHATVAHLAADTLRGSGQYARAAEAYAHAEQVWRVPGDTHAVLRTLHARAWLAMEAGQPAEETLKFTEAAHREIDEALAEDPGLAEPERLLLRLQTGHTHRQTAEILLTAGPPGGADTLTGALTHADQAVEAFRACGEAGLHEAADTELRAAALETDLGRYDAALVRTARVRDGYPLDGPDPDGTVAARLKEAGQLEHRIAQATR